MNPLKENRVRVQVRGKGWVFGYGRLLVLTHKCTIVHKYFGFKFLRRVGAKKIQKAVDSTFN